MTIDIRNGKNWIAAIDNDGVFVKFIGGENDIKSARNFIKYEKFNTLKEFSEKIRSQFKFSSCAGMVD